MSQNHGKSKYLFGMTCLASLYFVHCQLQSPSSCSVSLFNRGLRLLLFLEMGTQEKCNSCLRRLKTKLYWQTLDDQKFGRLQTKHSINIKHFTEHQLNKVYPSNFRLPYLKEKKLGIKKRRKKNRKREKQALLLQMKHDQYFSFKQCKWLFF